MAKLKSVTTMRHNLKKKVAILYSGGRYFGGIEKYLVNLFNNIDGEKFELTLLSLGEWQLTKQMAKQGHKVIALNGKRIRLGSINEIGEYLKNNQYSLLVSQGVVANTYARIVSFKYKIPNLVTVHSDLSGDYSNPLIRIAYELIDRFTRRQTSKYIAVSEFIKRKLVKSGISAKKISVIYNGLDFRQSKPRPHKRLVIGSAGRLHPVKGYDLLIQAFAEMKNKRLRLKIAGVGVELDNLQKLAQDLGVSSRVEFIGFEKDIYKFLDTIDVYVQSSKSEGFGLAVVEAMAQAMPVVVTPAGSLREIVKNGKTGYISADFEPTSIAMAISLAVENYESSKQIGENAKKYVTENFDIKQWVENTEKVFEDSCR